MNSQKRKSVNEIIDSFKELLNFKYDTDISRLLNISSQTIAQCRLRESPTILFPIMDYLVVSGISIETIFYKDKV